eukprot:9703741-Karenia_brevis.AAC.1
MDVADPAIQIRVQIITDWCEIWQQSQTKHKHWTKAWRQLHAKLSKLPATRRWHYVRGGITAVMATLMDIGWACPWPHKWRADNGDKFELTDSPMDSMAVIEAITASVRRG